MLTESQIRKEIAELEAQAKKGGEVSPFTSGWIRALYHVLEG